ncbi:MAG: hypothetical protein H6620_10965 [Halobacteriovoraceae bacterium]|nr:hypothetical protein [Halobacteriovoraceae bacterium]
MKILLLFITITLANNVLSQESRWVIGGSAGFNFGSVTVLEVSPRIGYRITSELTLGLGVGYRYYSDDSYSPSLNQNIFTGLAYGNYQINSNLYLHSEFDYTSFERVGLVSGNRILTKKREGISGLLVGGGYIIAPESRIKFAIEVLYDVLYDEQKSYRSEPLVIRGGVRYSF